MKDKSLPPRSKVPLEETWHLESIFATSQAWQDAFQETKNLISEMQEYQNQLDEGPETLIACLDLMEKLLTLAMKVHVYAGLAMSVDLSDQDAASRAEQAAGLLAQARAAVAFIQPELIQIGFETLQTWADEHEELAVYKHYFEMLEKRADLIRSPEVEEVLALSTEPLPATQPPAAYAALTNAELPFKPAVDSDGEEIDIGQSNIRALLSHADRQVRHTAWENYADAYLTDLQEHTGRHSDAGFPAGRVPGTGSALRFNPGSLHRSKSHPHGGVPQSDRCFQGELAPVAPLLAHPQTGPGLRQVPRI